MHPIRLVPWILWLALAAFSVATYDLLPDQIPQQIDAGGTVTRTVARSPLTWGMLPGVALLILAMTQAIALVLPSRPHLFNFPAKSKLLALPPAAQAPLLAQMGVFMDVTNLLVMLVLFGAQWTRWQSAQGQPSGVASTLLMVGSFAMAPVLVVLVFRLNAATERAHADWMATRQ